MVYKISSWLLVAGISLPIFLFQSCIRKGHDPCLDTGVQQVDLLLDDYQWPVWQREEHLTTAHTINGLEESFFVTKPNFRTDYGSRVNCTEYEYQTVSINYGSSVYNHGFSVYLTHQFDDVILKITDASNGYFGLKINLQYAIIDDEGLPIEIDDPSTPGNEMAEETTSVIFHDSLQVEAKLYRSVYEVRNTYYENHGKDYDVVAFYFGKENGLIKFVQKNGIEWVMD